LISQANAECQAVNGSAEARDIGQTGVEVDCTIEKPAPPEPVARPNPPPREAPDEQPQEQPTQVEMNFQMDDLIVAGEAESSIASAMVAVCRGFQNSDNLSAAQQDLLDLCLDINAESDSYRRLGAIQEIAAKQYSDIANLISFQNTISVSDVGNRLASMRSIMSQTARDVAYDTSQHPAPGLLAVNGSQHGGAAGDDESTFSRFGAFVLGSRGDGDKQAGRLSGGFDYSSSSITLGADYLVNRSTVMGVAFGQGQSKSRLLGDAGRFDIDTQNVSLYGSKYFNNAWYMDAILGLGKVKTQSQRMINFTANDIRVKQATTGEFNSDQMIFSVGLGRHFDSFVDVDVSMRMNHIDTAIERFEEVAMAGHKGFGLALEIESHEIVSTTSDVSASFSKAFSRNWGVLIPRATIRWLHEFEEGDDSLLGRFVADPTSFDFRATNVNVMPGDVGSTIFKVPLEKVDSNYGNLSLGVSALLPHQFSVNANISNTLGLRDFNHSYFSLTLRRDFQ
jgi:uncharacterized protein with beta-barrel porin domain